ncbi:unnamed protein product [Ostreobium quekettii]|uniref:Uncharacterized protein n=1 Tax=Ostreobium quekettii TaxID=121088 RepID=A0A8S1J980_9CHLO|nr:unnamed protein product [Ostreobium quekettii]
MSASFGYPSNAIVGMSEQAKENPQPPSPTKPHPRLDMMMKPQSFRIFHHPKLCKICQNSAHAQCDPSADERQANLEPQAADCRARTSSHSLNATAPRCQNVTLSGCVTAKIKYG